jgi:hypothetical protein
LIDSRNLHSLNKKRHPLKAVCQENNMPVKRIIYPLAPNGVFFTDYAWDLSRNLALRLIFLNTMQSDYLRTRHPYGLSSITFFTVGVKLWGMPPRSTRKQYVPDRTHSVIPRFYKPAFKEFSIRAEVQIREME